MQQQDLLVYMQVPEVVEIVQQVQAVIDKKKLKEEGVAHTGNSRGTEPAGYDATETS